MDKIENTVKDGLTNAKKYKFPVINPDPLLSNMMNVATKTNKLKES